MADDDEARTDEGQDSGANGAGSRLSGLASKEILIPAAVSAVGAVAAAAGPSLVRKLTSTTEEKAEQGAEQVTQSALNGARDALGNAGVAGKVLQKALPGGGNGDGGGGSGGKKTRRLPIQRWTDVAVPVDRAYEAWIEFDKYPKFMHRVQNVKKKGENGVQWQEKIWFSKRQWEGRITDKRENDRIAWKTTSGMSHKGVVSFHRLDDNLTRVMVDMEFEPNGMIEKMASGLRFVKRAVQADLARFKAYVEMEDAKGIEYRATRDDDDDKQQQDGEDRGRNDDKDDEERDAERREREGRREQRRQAVSA
jgi:type II secretory pathway pseudopilin PulG